MLVCRFARFLSEQFFLDFRDSINTDSQSLNAQLKQSHCLTQEARVALSYHFVRLLRFFRAKQPSI